MSQVLASFDYAGATDGGGFASAQLALAASIFADRPHLRSELAEDAAAAGFRVLTAGGVGDLLQGEPRGLGDLILIDVPTLAAAELAALTRLDARAAHAGSQVIVSTTLDALDAVFACCDQSSPQILIQPNRAERMIALGRALGDAPRGRVRDLTSEDRLTLLRLTEQVAQIAERLEGLNGGIGHNSGTGGVESPALTFKAPSGDASERLIRKSRPPLPEAGLVRRIIRNRQRRARFFDGELFADPVWDMLLDLTAARVEHTRVSVTSLCIASGVPPTTALRWIGQMKDAGLVQRIEDETDRRRAFMTLTDAACDAMARYFADLGATADRLC